MERVNDTKNRPLYGITVNYEHEDNGDWSSVDGPTLGHIEREMDDQGRLSGWETANGSNPGFAYDVNGRLEYETNSIGVVTRSVYNGVGWLVATTNLATGAWAGYGYDDAGRKISQTNAYGQVTRFDYWPSGSLKSMTNALGTNYWLYSDAASACASCVNSGSVTDSLGRVNENVTSIHGLPLKAIRRASAGATGANAVTNTTTYLSGLTTPEQEAEEYPASVTDEGGRTRHYDYSALGQLYRATDLSGSIWWTNQFDPDSGALTKVISPTGETNSYTYDELDNIKTIRFSDGQWLTNFYNEENRLSAVRLPSGESLTNVYDLGGRLTNRNSTLGETATFEYNGNDRVTCVIDNTGGTTNLYDAAGRLWGIDYPSGSSVRYQLDLLDRITGITNKASPGGMSYITRYQYDPVGNITNVIDPFNGSTSFEYDRVGRRTKRTLPNGIVTTWDYNWKDHVTNIVHKIGSTNLASVSYERAAGGEPTKITREDGTYVELKYDPAWRLTNEVYCSSGGSPQTTNSYTFDSSGNRIKFMQAGFTLTNSVSGGYQIAAVKNAANGNTTNSYSYDAGGRVTSINRDGAILNLGYNTADQVTAVTNASNWVTYTHDASGRRTISTNSSGIVRCLLVAPTPETDLESPHLIANDSASVQQGYVYLGLHPLLRYTNNGPAGYYLEDAMGSVIGLAPSSNPSTNNTTRLFYDGFGNLRSTNGPSPSFPLGANGDFRFQAAWLESDTILYNMRAREYDTRLGRFTSRDPRNGVFMRPETLNPYVYALNNPFAFTDPSGEFTLVESIVTMAKQTGIQGFRTVAIAKARQKGLKKLGKVVQNEIVKQIKLLFPVPELPSDWTKGVEFSRLIRNYICEYLPAPDSLFVEVPITVDGRPLRNGFTCNEELDPDELLAISKLKVPRPDFVIGQRPPKSAGGYNKTWIIGELKSTLATLYRDYIKPANNMSQFSAIVHYSGKHTHSHISLFVVATKGGKDVKKAVVETELIKSALKAKSLPFVIEILE